MFRFLYIILFILYSFTASCYWGLKWYVSSYKVGFAEFIFTIMSPMKGTGGSSLRDGIVSCFPKIGICIFLFAILYFFITPNKFSKKILARISSKIPQRQFFVFTLISMYIVVFLALGMILYKAYYRMGVDEFVELRKTKTLIYENEYVSPKSKGILSKVSTHRNLIHIVMESMETSYASTNVGGCLEYNYIPNLTKLALENDSFSDKENIGGFCKTAHASWTMAALLAFHSGIPFSFPIQGNLMSERKYFASGVTTLGDVLKGYGYNQVFLCGSDAEFGGRKSFFEQHGDYEIYDYGVALENDDIPDGYKVWWGFEDEYLYKIAKKKLLDLANHNKPFNLTFLTVDTHHRDGYICNRCLNKFESKTANVVRCADIQIFEFIDWCKKQDFYENTTIVITGDHLRMDKALSNEMISNQKRKLYFTVINSAKEYKRLDERQISSLDVFPTILSSLGFDIKNGRLGLGTDLYSDKKTLMEKYGVKEFNNEISKYSDFYMRNFP